MDSTVRGTIEMTAAMTIIGTIGWSVVMSGQPVMDVVFWRCAFGAVALLITCAALGLLRGRLTLRIVAIAALGGRPSSSTGCCCSAPSPRLDPIATAVYNTQPFMLVGFGALFFGERLTVAKLTWLGLAFAGMLLIVQTGQIPVPVSPRHRLCHRHRHGAWRGLLLGRRGNRCQEAEGHPAASDRADPGLRRRRHAGALRQPVHFPPTAGAGPCWSRLASSTPAWCIY